MNTLIKPVALVTGGSKRIGAQIVRSLHTSGYRVIIHCNRSIKEANLLANELNYIEMNTAVVLKQDFQGINELSPLQNFAQKVVSIWGRIDVLVHNASRFYPNQLSLSTHTYQQWDELFLTNVKAPYFLTQALLPYLNSDNASIVSILDIHANGRPFKGYGMYCMAKSAHQMMVQSLAVELAPNIRVNGVSPGVNVLPEAGSDQVIEQQLQANIIESIPLNKIGTPKDIADIVIFLLKAPYITGQVIAVDGGRSLSMKGG